MLKCRLCANRGKLRAIFLSPALTGEGSPAHHRDGLLPPCPGKNCRLA
jgi:hypothetical protein